MITIPYHIHAIDRVARRADDERPDVDPSTSTSRDPSAGNLNFERDIGWSSKRQGSWSATWPCSPTPRPLTKSLGH
jgi:hypothetical protein